MTKIATWNINSVRLRAGLVARFLKQARPDILCLQEIKCVEELFPREGFPGAGLSSHRHQRPARLSWRRHGSKLPLGPLPRESFCGTAEARHLGCAVALP